MGDTTHVRIYESDKEAIEDLVEDGSIPAKIRQIITMAEMYEAQIELHNS